MIEWHTKVMQCLKEIGVDDRELRIISGQYWDQAAVVRTSAGLSTEVSIKRGVRQGCVLSPSLFNLHTDKIFKEIAERNGVNIGGMNINNFRYADDTALVALNATDLQTLLGEVDTFGKPYGMEVNVGKTKCMVVSKTAHKIVDLHLDGEPIEQLSKFVYVGDMASEDGRSDAEIARRILIAKGAFTNMRKLFTCRSINIRLRLRFLKCCVWSTLGYGAETWTISRAMNKRLEAFEMWRYRRMLRISYIEHKKNEEVLNTMKTRRLLFDSIRKRKAKYFGHMIRQNGLQRLLLEGKKYGKKGKGRPRITWENNVKEWTGKNYGESVRAAENRQEWRSITANLLGADGT